jgi:hypothetical protein
MGWIVELLDDRVRDELEALPPDMQARFRRIVELIQGYGLEQVHEPHVKHLEGPLWEMRMKGRDGNIKGRLRDRQRPPCRRRSRVRQENAADATARN